MNPALVISFVVVGIVAIGILLQSDDGTGSAAPAPPNSKIGIFAAAIAKEENSPSSWNNPGDLTASFGFPVTGVANSAGVLIFATMTDGWNALYAQLQEVVDGVSGVYNVNDSLYGFGDAYSGGDPNWAVNVGKILGVDPSVPVGPLLGE